MKENRHSTYIETLQRNFAMLYEYCTRFQNIWRYFRQLKIEGNVRQTSESCQKDNEKMFFPVWKNMFDKIHHKHRVSLFSINEEKCICMITECAEEGCVLQCPFDAISQKSCDCKNGTKITTGKYLSLELRYSVNNGDKNILFISQIVRDSNAG